MTAPRARRKQPPPRPQPRKITRAAETYAGLHLGQTYLHRKKLRTPRGRPNPGWGQGRGRPAPRPQLPGPGSAPPSSPRLGRGSPGSSASADGLQLGTQGLREAGGARPSSRRPGAPFRGEDLRGGTGARRGGLAAGGRSAGAPSPGRSTGERRTSPGFPPHRLSSAPEARRWEGSAAVRDSGPRPGVQL